MSGGIWKYAMVLVVVGSLVSCRSTKVLGGAKIDTRLTVRNVIRNHVNGSTDFRTLSGKLGIDYSDGESEQSVTVTFRMKRDQVIWMSAPLGVAKVYITPTRVSFYNKLENEFFDGDFTFLSNLLGSEIDFQKLQNLLLGQAVVDLRNEKYDLGYTDQAYELKPKTQAGLYKLFFQIEPSYFRLASQQLSQPDLMRLMEVRYASYQQVAGQVVPDQVHIAAIDKDQRIDIGISYRQLEINRDLRFPYRIPKGYQPIASQ